MQLRYVFTELGNGLRRNLSMHIAVILTLFVSLTLVGLGFLLNQEAKKVSEQWGNQLTVTVYLCSRHDGNPACTGQVTDAQKQQIQQVIDANSQVDTTTYISQDQAFETLKEQFPGKYDGAELTDHRRGHARVDPDHAQGPEPVQGRRERGRGSRRGLARARRPQGAGTDLQHDLQAQVGRLGHRDRAGRRGPAAGREHDPAGGVRTETRDRDHEARGRLDALHRAAVPPRGAWSRPCSAWRSRVRRSGRSWSSWSASSSPRT